MLSKIRNALNDLWLALVKSTLYTPAKFPDVQFLVRFALRPALIEIQIAVNSRDCTEWILRDFDLNK